MRSVTRSWPRFLTLAFGLAPLFMLAMLVANMLVRSGPLIAVLKEVGYTNIFSSNFNPIFGPALGASVRTGSFGFMPAMTGSLMVVIIAMAVALPTSIAIAVLASEFSNGVVGNVLRLVLGLLSGIPPIIYAMASTIFVTVVIMPKFTANSVLSTFDPDEIGYTGEWPPDNIPWTQASLPWNVLGLSNSSLLGGVLLAMLAIPFMAPLIDDAIRGVSNNMKEASLALGASKWLTLRRITIPLALDGIVAATTLGTLKVMGDLMISFLIISSVSRTTPNPFFDVLEKTSTLPANSAGVLGGLSSSCSADICSVAFFQAFLLFAFALVVVGASTYMQRRLRRRYR